MSILAMTVSGSLMILIITVVRAVAIDRLHKRLFSVRHPHVRGD